MPKAPRKHTPRANEVHVLDQSRRRCTLCFYLHSDLSEKHGQIAHLDNDPANDAEDNLAFMCIEHHSLYDSTTSQHKNYTIHEIKAARARLYQAIASGDHTNIRPSLLVRNAGLETDRQTLADIVDLMSKTGTVDFLRTNNFAGWSFQWSRLDGIQRSLDRNGPEHEFLDDSLETLRSTFQTACVEFIGYVALNTFVVGTSDRQGVPEEWEFEQTQRFKETVSEIHERAERVCRSYDELIRTAKRRLSA